MKNLILICQLMMLAHKTIAQKPVIISPFSSSGKLNIFKIDDTTKLYETLKLCPDRSFTANKPASTVQISLPSSKKGFDLYDIYETHILKPELAAKYPYIKTYFAQCVTDETKLAYLTFSPTISQLTFINNEGFPSLKKNNTTQEFRVVTFTKENRGNFMCGNNDSQPGDRLASTLATTHVQNCNAYLITSAFSCSKRFSQAAADEIAVGTTPTVAISLAKITSILNNEINPVYEREAAISFDLVSDEDDVICINTDQFIENDILLSTFINHGFIQLRIDDPQYKMGFLLDKLMPGGTVTTTVGSSTGRICGSQIGWNGGYYYDEYNGFHLETILHEIGHFFGARHTFNFIDCGYAENTEASVEPYGGYSIMGYSNSKSCWVNRLNDPGNSASGFSFETNWPNTIPSSLSYLHFNSISLKQIFNTLSTANCLNPSLLPCSDLDAIANTPTQIIIPKGTSFMLRGNKTSNDNSLYYQFDQVDNGLIMHYPPIINNPTIPIPLSPSYRSTNNPLRFFRGPMYGDSNQMLSNVGREMNFNYLKRKITDGGFGVTDINYKKVIISENAGPFEILSIKTTLDGPYAVISDFKFNEPCHIQWSENNIGKLPNSKLLDIYLIHKDKIRGNTPFTHFIDSTDFILVAKDVPNDGDFNGGLYFDRRIAVGRYHLVLMTKDKTIFTFSQAEIEINSQLIYPIGGEIIMQGDIENKAYYILDENLSSMANIYTHISLYIGTGYNLVNYESMALDSILLPTNQSHVSPNCKVKIEFRDGVSGPVLEMLESEDFFKITDQIPSLTIPINNFTTLNTLAGNYVIPAINAVLEGISVVKTKLDNQSDLPPIDFLNTGLGDYPCFPPEVIPVPRPKSYSYSFDEHQADISNIGIINSLYLHQRITNPFFLDYEVTTNFSGSNTINFQSCNYVPHGPCNVYGYTSSVSNCHNIRCYEDMQGGYDTSYYYCNPGYSATLTLSSYVSNLYLNEPPANTEVQLNLSAINPSRNPILLSPNGRERIEEDGYMVVSWINPFFEPDNDCYANIYISSDNGNNYRLLAAGVASFDMINKYSIDPPNSLTQGSSYRIKVELTKSSSRIGSPFLGLNDVSDYTFSVIPNVKPVSIIGLDSVYCTTDPPVTLVGSPAGGQFRVNGITTNIFNPASVGTGRHNILYIYDGAGFSLGTFERVRIENCSQTIVLNLKLFLEGFYSDVNIMRANLFDLGISSESFETDTVIVNLWNPLNLSNPEPDHSVKAVINTDGTATLLYPETVNGNSYFIAVKHRNHLETWSKLPVTFTSTTSYDFSDDLQKAYDDGVNPPMAAVAGGKFAFYGGDVNQDGTVDASDMADVDNDNAAFAYGYNVTDASGDGATDASDISIVDNNQQLFLFYARPF